MVSRPGFGMDELEAMPLTTEQRARVHVLQGLADPTSATEVRAGLQRKQPCDDLLPDTVCNYIQENRLYGAE